MNAVFFEGLGALGWSVIAVGGVALIMRTTGAWQPRVALTV